MLTDEIQNILSAFFTGKTLLFTSSGFEIQSTNYFIPNVSGSILTADLVNGGIFLSLSAILKLNTHFSILILGNSVILLSAQSVINAFCEIEESAMFNNSWGKVLPIGFFKQNGKVVGKLTS